MVPVDRNIGSLPTPTDQLRRTFGSAENLYHTGYGFTSPIDNFNVDMSLVKKFKIGDRDVVLFRAEAYNLFNNVNFVTPNANRSTPNTFGKIAETAGNPRYLQLALRHEF